MATSAPAATSVPAAETPVAAAATPQVRYAVAYFLKMLAYAAIGTVKNLIQLAADIRTVLSLPWASQAVGAAESLSALPYNTFVTLLKKILSESLLPTVGARTLSAALASDFSVDEIISLSSMLQRGAPSLTDLWHPNSTKSSPIQKTIAALVVMSLWALFYAALPGLSGLFVAGVTGVRIGYRQAKAGIALHTMELARFARPGPIGIVRTGSLVSVHMRTAPADHTARRQHLRIVS
ncbi:hypothetical protein [Mycobacterium sp. NPDC050441]|uniref:hypothetical protein n=1 Tax=Mycobacterium sp. NPDC050441 TaxID=3155403 RepID=UPI0033DDF521